VSIQARVLEALRWTTATRFAGYLLTWTINLFVIRLLRPEDYGLMALATAWVGFAELLSGFGQRIVVVQRPTLDEALLRKIFGALVVWNLALFAFVVTAAPWLAGFYGDGVLTDVVRVMAAAILVSSMAILPAALRWREIDFPAVSLVALAQAVVTSVTVLALALRGHGVWALVWGQVAGHLVHTVGILWVTGVPLRPDFRLRGIGADLRFGGLVTARAVVGFFERQVDVILIGKLLGSVPLGAYSVAASVAKQPSRALLQPLHRVATPAFARVQDDPAQVRAYFVRSIQAVVFVFVPMLWGIGVVADDLVGVVMGARWEPAIPILQILCLFLPLRAPLRIVSATLDGVGRPDVSLRQVVTMAVCTPVGILAGAPFGIVGATWGWTAAQAVALTLNLRRALPVIGVGFGPVARAVGPSLAAAGAMAGAVLAAKATWLAPLDPALRLAASVALGALVYGAAMVVVDRPQLRRWARIAARGGRPAEPANAAREGDGSPASSA